MQQYSRIVAGSIRDWRVLSEIRGYFYEQEFKTMNGQNKLALWAGRISACRNGGMNVESRCKENGVCEQTYCKWQRRLFEMAQMQPEVQFAEVTSVRCSNVAVTV